MSDSERPGWKRPLKIAVSLALLVGVGSIVDRERIGDVLRGADLKMLALVPPLWLLGAAFSSLRWRVVLKATGVEYSWLRCFQAYMVSAFYSLLLPGAVGGDAARVAFAVKDAGAEAGSATGTILIERVGGALGLLGWVLGVSVFTPEVAATMIGGPTAGLQIGALVLLGSGPLVYFAARRWLPRGKVPFLSSLLGVLDDVGARVLAASLALSMVFQFVRLVAIWTMAHALGVELSLASVLAVFPLVFLASMVPISFGGLGVREASSAALLMPFGVAAGPAALLGFGIYLLQVISAGIGGLVQLRRASVDAQAS